MTWPKIPPAQDFQNFFALLGLLANPDAAKQRLEELSAAAEEARGLILQAKNADADLDAKRAEQERRLSRELVEHQDKIALDRSHFSEDCLRREREIARREKVAVEHEAATKFAREAAEKRKADLEARLVKLRSLAA